MKCPLAGGCPGRGDARRLLIGWVFPAGLLAAAQTLVFAD